MAKRDLPPATALRQLFRYEESGRLYWEPRGPEWYLGKIAEARSKAWNNTHAGKEAFWPDRLGYRIGALMGHRISAHRVIWAMHNGKWPEGEIDHINGNPSDNRIENLRHVTRQGNARNQRRFANNASGHTGVYWVPHLQRWRSTIKVDNKLLQIGYFNIKAEAVAARLDAQAKHGFHPNHGRAA